MTTEAATNSVQTESVSVQPSTDINDPANLDFEDELDASASANEEKPEARVEGETDESTEEDGAQEAEQSEDDDNTEEQTEEAEADEPKATAVDLPDDAVVTLPDGEKVKLGDLKKSRMMEADYRRKTQELGNQRRAVADQATRIQGVTDAFANFLAEQVPNPPPRELAWTDPAAYTQQKVMYETAMERVQAVIELGMNAKGTVQELSEADRAKAMTEANEKLLEALPELREPAKRQAFNQQTWDTARHFGFTAEELAAVSDHRFLVLGHYAAKGLKAEQAGKKVQQKVQAAPKVTPAKTAASAKGNPDFLRNKEAMRRLAKTGSINDALSIDFD